MLSILQYACFSLCAFALVYQAVTCAMAIARCRSDKIRRPPIVRPPITVVRPLRGLEVFSHETLQSTFDIDYPEYEILFCVADRNDPVIPLLQKLIRDNPERDVSILIGVENLGQNPKLNNMAKGFRSARFEYIVFVDSNVFTPADYLDQLVNALETGAGMVSAPPVGSVPRGFWAELECAFLNSYQARIQYAVDCLGMGFAQGKTLFFKTSDLEHGGLARLASDPAEDAAATKMMRSKGKHVRLAGPFLQLIGPRSFAQVWQRQIRWARLRRASFPLLFVPEIFAGVMPPIVAFLVGIYSYGLLSPALIIGFIVVWYLPEIILLRAARWSFSLPALMLRDALLPAVFITGCASRDFEWHGKAMTTAREEKSPVILTSVRRKHLWARLAGR